MDFPIHFGLQKIDLPLILIEFQGVNLCMLLDTGANNNFIDNRICKQFKEHIEKSEDCSFVFGLEGDKVINERIKLTFKFEEEFYTTFFDTLPENNGFKNIEEDEGVQIHGVLGSMFFVEHKWIIDFAELKIYSK